MNTKPPRPLATFRSAARLASVGVSEILKIGALATELRRRGQDVIVLAAGEPDFDTPQNVKAAAARAMAVGATKYTPLEGTPELKAAIAAKFRRDNALDYQPAEIIVCTGAKQVLFNAMMASLDPEDEVIIPTPCWVSYIDIVRVAGGRPVLVPCSEANGFRLTAGELERAITPRTRWVLFNSPSNPTGAIYGKAEYRPLLDVLLRHPQVWLIADDIYEHIIYDDVPFVTPAGLEPQLRDRTLTVSGVSKAYAMTGWRIGYGAGPPALIHAMAVVQSQSTSCPSSVSQAAATEALNGPQHVVDERRGIFQARRDRILAALGAIGGIRCHVPAGAFYIFASCAGLMGRKVPGGGTLGSDQDFSEYLLRSAGVAVIPGSAFGLAPYFRLSYAASTEELDEAVRRMSAACARLT